MTKSQPSCQQLFVTSDFFLYYTIVPTHRSTSALQRAWIIAQGSPAWTRPTLYKSCPIALQIIQMALCKCAVKYF